MSIPRFTLREQNIKTELEKEMTAKVSEILKGVVDSQIKENLAAINASLSNIYEESNNQQDEIELLKLSNAYRGTLEMPSSTNGISCL
jgi:argonaute-like protein implicated in RNA metabolism and viral defense